MSTLVRIEHEGADRAREELASCIAAGGIAVFPADGLYGLACDPMSPAAVRRIHDLKGRPPRKPSAVMYFSALVMRELVSSMGRVTREAVGSLLPGPVTLVIANPEGRYPLACADEPGRLGVRLIDGPLDGLAFPVFQTSANLSGEPPPAAFASIDTSIVEGADLAIDGGTLSGKPSTVIDISEIDRLGGKWEILREGGMPRSAVEAALASVDRG